MESLNLGAAHQHLQLRNFSEAAPLYLKAINETPQQTPAWEGLFACLGGLGMPDKAVALVDTRQQRFNDGMVFYFNGLTRMVASGLYDVAEAVVTAIPNKSLLYIVARYGAGLVNLHRARPAAAAEHFAAAAAMAEQYSDHFWSDPLLQKIIIDGQQFQGFSELGALIERDRAAVIADSGIIALDATFNDREGCDAPFVVCAGMNEAYLDRFGETAAAAVQSALAGVRDATFHLHIVDPTPALPEKLARLRASVPSLRLGLSTETYNHDLQGYGRATFYASARFLRAPEIIAHYRKPVMIVDIDIANLSRIAHVMQSFGDGSYGCFEQKGQLPGLVCHASIITIGCDRPSLRFADLTAKLIARRVATQPFWTLDQTSILVASRYLSVSDEAFRAIDLAAASGCTFDDCFTSSGNAKEKQTMRSTLAMRPAA